MQSTSCEGKKAYRHYTEAYRMLRYVIRQSQEGSGQMSVYRCRYCQDYHFGHDTKRKKNQ